MRLTTDGGNSGQATVLEEVLLQSWLVEREAFFNVWRQREDVLLAAGMIAERRLISGRMMKRLYEAFGEEAVKAALAD